MIYILWVVRLVIYILIFVCFNVFEFLGEIFRMDTHQKEYWRKLSKEPVECTPGYIKTRTSYVKRGDTQFQSKKYDGKYHSESEAQPD